MFLIRKVDRNRYYLSLPLSLIPFSSEVEYDYANDRTNERVPSFATCIIDTYDLHDNSSKQVNSRLYYYYHSPPLSSPCSLENDSIFLARSFVPTTYIPNYTEWVASTKTRSYSRGKLTLLAYPETKVLSRLTRDKLGLVSLTRLFCSINKKRYICI